MSFERDMRTFQERGYKMCEVNDTILFLRLGEVRLTKCASQILSHVQPPFGILDS